MIKNVFANVWGNLDRGSHYLLGRIDIEVHRPFIVFHDEIGEIEAITGYSLSFYEDDELLATEEEETERMGGSPFAPSYEIFKKTPITVSKDEFVGWLCGVLTADGSVIYLDESQKNELKTLAKNS